MPMQQCPRCGGRGEVQTPSGQLWQVCPLCGGSGEDPGVERFFVYATDVSLLANQNLPNQRIVISGDAPFRIKIVNRVSTGAFRIRLFDTTGRGYASSGQGGTNDRVRAECVTGDGQLPFPIWPYIEIPIGGYIGFDLEDVSAAPNSVHLAFVGAKVYPTPTKNG